MYFLKTESLCRLLVETLPKIMAAKKLLTYTSLNYQPQKVISVNK